MMSDDEETLCAAAAAVASVVVSTAEEERPQRQNVSAELSGWGHCYAAVSNLERMNCSFLNLLHYITDFLRWP